MKILCTNFFAAKKENLGHDQVRLLRCESCRPPLRVLLLFLVHLAGLPLLASCFCYFYVVLLRIRGFCGFEFENSAQQQPVSLYFEFIARLDALHSVLNSLYLHANEQASPAKQILFSWGHDPYTLACKARPSFDGFGTSQSVSLSLPLPFLNC